MKMDVPDFAEYMDYCEDGWALKKDAPKWAKKAYEHFRKREDEFRKREGKAQN